MGILNIQTETIGQTGLIPRFVYIETNDDIAGVTITGYLNHAVSQGYNFLETEMALVSTKLNPSDTSSSTSLYTIEHVGGNFTLKPIENNTPVSNAWLLGGNNTSGAEIFGTLNNNEIDFRASNVSFMTVSGARDIQMTPNSLDITSITSIILTCINNLTLDTQQSIIIGTGSAAHIFLGNNTNDFQINSPIITLQNLPNAVTGELVHYNSTTKAISYGPASFSAGQWLLAGNSLTGGTAKLGTLDNQPFDIVINNTARIEMQTALVRVISDFRVEGGYFFQAQGSDTGTFYVTNTTLTLFAFGSLGAVQAGSTNSTLTINDAAGIVGTGLNGISFASSAGLASFEGKTVNIESHGHMIFQANNAGSNLDMVADTNATFEATGGILRFNAPSLGGSVQVAGDLKLLTIVNTTTSSSLYYDTTSKSVTYGPTSAGTIDWHVTGNTGTGGTAKLGTTDAQPYALIVNNASIITIAANRDIVSNPHDFTVNSATNLMLTCVNSLTLDTQQSIFLGQGATAHMFVGNATNDFTLYCPLIAIPNLPSAVKPDVVYYDTTSKAISHGPAGTAGLEWLLAGNTGAGHKLGTTDANGWVMIADNVNIFNVDALHNISWGINNNPTLTLTGITIDVGFTGANTTQINIGNAASQTSGFGTSINFTATGGSSNAIFDGNTVFIGATNAANGVNIGKTGGPITNLLASIIKLPNISNATKSDIIYYDSTSKEISFATAGAASGQWLLAGNTGGGHVLGTTDNNGFTFIANNSVFATILADKTTQFNSGPLLTLDASRVEVGPTAATQISVGSNTCSTLSIIASNQTFSGLVSTTIDGGSSFAKVNGARVIIGDLVATTTVEIGHSSMTTMTAVADNVTITGTTATNLNSATIILASIPSVATANVVYIHPSTKALSYGPIAGALDWLLAGNSGTGGTAKLGTLDNQPFDIVANNTNLIHVSPTVLDVGNTVATTVNLRSTNSGLVQIDGDQIKIGSLHSTTINIGVNATTQTNVNSAIVNFIGTSTAIIDGQAAQLGPLLANNIQIGRNPSITALASNSIKAPNIPSAVTANILYFNPSGGAITYGLAPVSPTVDWHVTGNSGTGGTGKLGTLDSQPFTIVANNQTMVSVSNTTLGYGIAGSTTHTMLGMVFNGQFNNNFTLDATNTLLKQSSNVFLQATASGIDIGHTSYPMNIFTDTNLRLRNIPPATKPNILYIDQSDNGKIYYGPATGGAINRIITHTIDTLGAGTYTPTTGMVYATVEVIGGGASGDGTSGDNCGAGGGAGGFATKTYLASDIGVNQPYFVGQAGPTGALSSPGQSTTFGTGGTLITGGGAPAVPNPNSFKMGGAGGAGIGGSLNARGGAGGAAIKVGSVNYHGIGGASIFNGTTQGGGSGGANQDGQAAQTFGGGGEGGISVAAGASNGGAGKQGVILILEYVSA